MISSQDLTTDSGTYFMCLNNTYFLFLFHVHVEKLVSINSNFIKCLTLWFVMVPLSSFKRSLFINTSFIVIILTENFLLLKMKVEYSQIVLDLLKEISFNKTTTSCVHIYTFLYVNVFFTFNMQWNVKLFCHRYCHYNSHINVVSMY